MSAQQHYKPRDFGFAQRLSTLRKRASLTQDDLALKIGVAEKTIRNWEGGINYPTDVHLRKLIELYLNQQLFTMGQEEEEIRTLWEQLRERSHHQNLFLDEQWLAALLKSWQEYTPSQMPPPDGLPCAWVVIMPSANHLSWKRSLPLLLAPLPGAMQDLLIRLSTGQSGTMKVDSATGVLTDVVIQNMYKEVL